MNKSILIAAFGLLAAPAQAASGPFFSLGNTNFIVLLAFILFVVVLAYFKVPGTIGGLLDKRAEGIRNDLDEAKALRDEAHELLASYDRKQREVQEQAARIVAHAKDEAEAAAAQARADLEISVARRLAAAEDQIASAESAAIRDVRDQAIAIAISATREVVASQMSAAAANKLIEESIKEVDAKLH